MRKRKMSKPLIPPTVYHDGVNLYLEWSGHAQRFPFTEGGLAKALKFIPHIASSPGYVTGRSNIADKLIDTRKAKIARKTAEKREIAAITEGQRQSVSEMLRAIRARRAK
jgi:hypothetical protein